MSGLQCHYRLRSGAVLHRHIMKPDVGLRGIFAIVSFSRRHASRQAYDGRLPTEHR
jgi:hypothetical protein